MGKDKQPATLTNRKLATNVDGHEIAKPRLLDAEHEREIDQRNSDALTRYQADAGIEEVSAPESESPRPNKTADVKPKE